MSPEPENSAPTPTRQCGSCTACCDGWLNTEVNGLKVSPGHPCPHSTPGGCAIYATRPQYPCRDFQCGWMRWDSELPDWMRPNDCGAIVFLWFDWQGQKVINAVPVGEKIPERTLDWLKAHAQEQGRPLMFFERIMEDGQFTGAKCTGFGPPAFRKQVESIKLAKQQNELLDMFSSVATPPG
jgi:hypothetical protein